jgi:putative peptidoglycan lipid II flippase
MAQTIYESLQMILFILMPACVGLIILAHPICKLLFEHGRFTSFETQLTSEALVGYSVGLLAYAVIKVLANAFYALGEPKIPVKIAACCIPLNIFLNLLLMGALGVGGLALATALSAWTNTIALFSLLRKHLVQLGADVLQVQAEKTLKTTFSKTLLACLGMSLFLMGFLQWGAHWHGFWQVLLGILGGILVFMFLAKCLKIKERKTLWHLIGFEVSED